MTLEELKNKIITLSYVETFRIKDIFEDDILKEMLDYNTDKEIEDALRGYFTDTDNLFYKFGDSELINFNIK